MSNFTKKNYAKNIEMFDQKQNVHCFNVLKVISYRTSKMWVHTFNSIYAEIRMHVHEIFFFPESSWVESFCFNFNLKYLLYFSLASTCSLTLVLHNKLENSLELPFQLKILSEYCTLSVSSYECPCPHYNRFCTHFSLSNLIPLSIG